LTANKCLRAVGGFAPSTYQHEIDAIKPTVALKGWEKFIIKEGI
jgi:hypothetical protein